VFFSPFFSSCHFRRSSRASNNKFLGTNGLVSISFSCSN
jgi:hypothetical protein